MEQVTKLYCYCVIVIDILFDFAGFYYYMFPILHPLRGHSPTERNDMTDDDTETHCYIQFVFIKKRFYIKSIFI